MYDKSPTYILYRRLKQMFLDLAMIAAFKGLDGVTAANEQPA